MRDSIRVGVARTGRHRDGQPIDDLVEALVAADDVVVVGEATYQDAVVDDNDSENPDVVLVDIGAGNGDGLAAAERIVLEHPSVRVIVLSGSEDRGNLEEAVRAGARGYVVKPADRQHLVEAVRLVAAGHMVIDAKLAEKIRTPTVRRPDGSEAVWDLMLTEREIEVLALAVAGHSNEDIAERLQVGDDTVRRHFGSICLKLEAEDREAVVAIARRVRLFVGRGRGRFGIWDIRKPEPPVELFGRDDRAQAWRRWRELVDASERPRWWRGERSSLG